MFQIITLRNISRSCFSLSFCLLTRGTKSGCLETVLFVPGIGCNVWLACLPGDRFIAQRHFEALSTSHTHSRTHHTTYTQHNSVAVDDRQDFPFNHYTVYIGRYIGLHTVHWSILVMPVCCILYCEAP